MMNGSPSGLEYRSARFSDCLECLCYGPRAGAERQYSPEVSVVVTVEGEQRVVWAVRSLRADERRTTCVAPKGEVGHELEN